MRDQSFKMIFRKFIAHTYIFLVLGAVLFLTFRSLSAAGQIRDLRLSQSVPGKVYLALGHTTAISFPSKPERLVLGAPTHVAVDFLGNDVTVTPLAKDPGNLIVYTKSGRYVILFEARGPLQYDDVVNIRFGVMGAPLKLLTDSGFAVTLVIEFTPINKKEKTKTLQKTAFMQSSEKIIEGSDLSDLLHSEKRFRCQGCSVPTKGTFQISCVKPITELKCSSDAFSSITIRRQK